MSHTTSNARLQASALSNNGQTPSRGINHKIASKTPLIAEYNEKSVERSLMVSNSKDKIEKVITENNISKSTFLANVQILD